MDNYDDLPVTGGDVTLLISEMERLVGELRTAQGNGSRLSSLARIKGVSAGLYGVSGRLLVELSLPERRVGPQRSAAPEETSQSRLEATRRALEEGRTPEVVVSIATRLRRRIVRHGPQTATQFRDLVSAGEVALWTTAGGVDGRRGLRDISIAYGVQQGWFRLHERRYVLCDLEGLNEGE